MSSPERPEFVLATSSTYDGLDFACMLLTGGIAAEAETHPELAVELVCMLTQYIEYRYVGEIQLALEKIIDLGTVCNNDRFRRKQFWAQLKWVADQMDLSKLEYEQLKLLED